MMTTMALVLALALGAVAVPAARDGVPGWAGPPGPGQAMALDDCADLEVEGARCGRHQVAEDRDRPDGRRLTLDVVVLPATGPEPRPDPIFYLPGGPGAPATPAARSFDEHPARERHDIVFVDVRGTAGAHALSCAPEGEDDLRDLLAVFPRVEIFVECRERLAATVDFAEYSTPRMVDDFEAVRRALGYGPVNLIGISGGTRTAQVWMRRYPDAVRAAVLNGVVPFAFRNPLHHARSAQDALDGLLELCASRRRCASAYPDLAERLAEVVARLEDRPVEVTVEHPEAGEPVELTFDRLAFVESIRQLMYRGRGGSRVPLLIRRASEGDFRALGERAVAGAVGGSISMGLLNSIVCSEDATRIEAHEIGAETEGTLLGDARVRRQLAVCDVWPVADLDPGYADPVPLEQPTLLISGTLDPVTPPRWGDEAARHLPNALHLVVPGGHAPGGDCLARVLARFFAAGTVDGLDTSCTRAMSYPEFELPGSG